MHPADIKAAIAKAGSTQARIAASLKVTASAVGNVIHGASRSAAIAHHISQVTGIPVRSMWPNAYGRLASEVESGHAPKPHFKLLLNGSLKPVRRQVCA